MSFEIRAFEDWQELRQIRLRALEDSPEWFAAKFEVESAKSPEEWKTELEAAQWRLIAKANENAGMMRCRKQNHFGMQTAGYLVAGLRRNFGAKG